MDEKGREDLLESPVTPKGTTANEKMNEVKKMREQMNLVERRKKIEEDKKRKMENILNNIHTHGAKAKEDSASNIPLNPNFSYFGPSNEPKLTGGFQGTTPIRNREAQEFKGNYSYVTQKQLPQNSKVPKQHSSKHLLNHPIILEHELSSKEISVDNPGDVSTFGKAADRAITRKGSRQISNTRQSKVFAQDDYNAMQKIRRIQRFGQTQIGPGHYEEPIASNTKETNQEQEMGFEIDAYFINHFDNEHENQLKELENKRYVPVALCLETETEYHDTFRQIMLSIFDLIREPETLVSKFYDNRTMAFAELVAHLAFLRTIPAPPFNSVYNIYCLNQVFQIKESSFDQIPNKNQFPIRILFDVLDVRSIFYCWKALLFDKTLVLVSSQYSLQFYIAEALKQLLFPMTWQNTYIQPGNESLAGHCDGTMVCLYGSNSMVNGFDFFEALQHPEICICDIDAGFTNNIDLPCIPDETMYIRILNTLKNSKINQYDKAYPDSQIPDAEDFVSQVRETFFGMLKPFLSKVDEFIDCQVDNQSAFFQKYFKVNEYLEHFENYGQLHQKFAKALTDSSQFQHFCDDYFSDEDHNNYKMLQEIYKARGEIHTNHRSSDQKKKMSDNMLDSIKNIEELQKKKKNGKGCLWPDTDPVTFNFRMPTDQQRVMLFEKIFYMIESSLKKKERDISRKTNENLINNKDSLLYEKVIQTIKSLYPIKLKGTHKKFALPDIKLQQLHLQKKFGMSSTIETGKAQMNQYFNHQQQTNPRQKSPDSHLAIDHSQITSFIEQRTYSKLKKSAIQHQKSIYVSNSQYPSPNVLKNTQKENQQLADVKRELLPQLNDKSITRIPLDVMNSEIGASSSLISESHMNLSDYLIKIGLNKQRIAKLMYGKLGLVSFLNHLFGLLSKKQLLRVNYYFALKQQMDQLTLHAKKLSKQKMELRKNIPIPEEGFEEDKSPTNQARSRPTPQSSSQNISQGLGAQKSHSSQSTFKSEKEWLSIDHWDLQGCILKQTYQVSLFKQKMYESFENPEDGYSLVWKELLKFPSNKMKFFPTSKYLQIWDSLTHSQQQEVFAKFGQKQDKPQIQLICKQYVKRGTYVRSSTDPVYTSYSSSKKNNEDIFYNNSIEKTWKQKQIERKELMQASKASIKQDSSSSILQPSPKGKESQQKQEAKKQKVIDSNQRTIQDYLKQKLEMKKLKSLDIGSSSAPNDYSRSMKKPPPLSTKSTTSEQFIFKGLSKEDSPPGSARLPNLGSQDSRPSTASKSQSVLQHKKSDSTLSFQPANYQMGDISALKHSEQKVKPMSDPLKMVERILLKIQVFWKRNAQYISKSGSFKEEKLEALQEDLKSFDKYFSYFKSSKPVFQGDNIGKQCFFLNLFNFLVLYQLAVLMLSNPDAVNKLTNYNMWQAFLISASIKVAYIKLTAFNIMHSILRNTFQPPQISAFMLNTQANDCHEQNEFKVIQPHRLICFGFFLPMKKMPELRVFKQDEFEDQLRISAYLYLIDRVQIKDDHYLIILPKILQWFASDTKAEYFTGMLDFLEKRVFREERILQIQRVLDKISSKQTNANDYIVEYQYFSWVFDPQHMVYYFGDKSNPFQGATDGNE